MKPELIVDAPIAGQKKIWIKKLKVPYFDHPFHFHNLCELVWIQRGYGKLIIGDYVGSFDEGEVILKAAELPHLWKSDVIFHQQNAKLYTQATSIYFPTDLILHITDDVDNIRLYQDLSLRAQRGVRFVGSTRQGVIKQISKIVKSRGLAQMGIFLKIIDTLVYSQDGTSLASHNYQRSTDEHDIQRFNMVYQHLLQNFQQAITLTEVADICNMSPNAFCRFFKKKTQKTLIQFLNEIRIGHACKLLQNGDLTLKSICYTCGYNNPVSFFAAFKQVKEMTPTEYREAFNKKSLNATNL